jgi:hypothetical protein
MRLIVVIPIVAAALATASVASAERETKTSLWISNTIVATWRCQDKLPAARTTPGESPWKLGRHSENYRQALLTKWIKRKNDCLAVLEERARQWNWQAFLPGEWRRLGVCETGLNWRHANGSFVSAFGISRQAYDEDAAVMGAPPWNDARPPSPWNQYQAALGHHRIHGGFSGWGCRGA